MLVDDDAVNNNHSRVESSRPCPRHRADQSLAFVLGAARSVGRLFTVVQIVSYRAIKARLKEERKSQERHLLPT